MVDRLLSKGHDVVVLDNLATGLRGNVPGTARFLWGDVSRLDDVGRAFEGGLDAVFHIAGQVSLIRSYADPTADLLTNVLGTVNVLKTCVKNRVPRLIYASSMTVYSGDAPLRSAARSRLSVPSDRISDVQCLWVPTGAR
jgi:UDP-glucose 4-epimerase